MVDKPVFFEKPPTHLQNQTQALSGRWEPGTDGFTHTFGQTPEDEDGAIARDDLQNWALGLPIFESDAYPMPWRMFTTRSLWFLNLRSQMQHRPGSAKRATSFGTRCQRLKLLSSKKGRNELKSAESNHHRSQLSQSIWVLDVDEISAWQCLGQLRYLKSSRCLVLLP